MSGPLVVLLVLAGMLTVCVALLIVGALRVSLERERRSAHYRCSCEHPHAVHDPVTGRCAEMIERLRYDTYHAKSRVDYVLCPCYGFDGQLPPSVYERQALRWPEVGGNGNGDDG